MAVLLVIVNILLVLVALVLVVAVLMQQGNSAGLGSIGGGAETFLGKNKARSIDGKLAMITKGCATAFIVLAVIMTLLQG